MPMRPMQAAATDAIAARGQKPLSHIRTVRMMPLWMSSMLEHCKVSHEEPVKDELLLVAVRGNGPMTVVDAESGVRRGVVHPDVAEAASGTRVAETNHQKCNVFLTHDAR